MAALGILILIVMVAFCALCGFIEGERHLTKEELDKQAEAKRARTEAAEEPYRLLVARLTAEDEQKTGD